MIWHVECIPFEQVLQCAVGAECKWMYGSFRETEGRCEAVELGVFGCEARLMRSIPTDSDVVCIVE